LEAVEKFPFEVSETGWGEFQIQIKVLFQDPNQRPLNLVHHLKLYPSEDLGELKTSKSVISEHYDEVLFEPPSQTMANLLTENEDKSDVTKGPKFRECKAVTKDRYIDELIFFNSATRRGK